MFSRSRLVVPNAAVLSRGYKKTIEQLSKQHPAVSARFGLT